MSYLFTGGSSNGGGGSIAGSRNTSMPRRSDNSYATSTSSVWFTPRVPNPLADEDPTSTSPLSVLAVPPRLGLSPAYCIPLVTTTCASKHSSGELGEVLTLRGCHQLPVSQELACLLGTTGSATRELIVQPTRYLASGAAGSGSGPAAASASASASASDSAAASLTATSSPMCSSGDEPLLDASFVRSLLNAAWPRLGLNGVHIAPVSTHPRPQRIYELRVSRVPKVTAESTHDMLILVLSPPSMLRLLRSERWILKSEVVIVKWIRSVLLAGGSTRATHVDLGSDGTYSCANPARVVQHAQMQDDFLFKDIDLSELLPALIDHSQSAKDFGTAYSILSHLTGLCLSSFPYALSVSERSHVDFQAGRLVRRLSHLPSPSGKFGPALSVLCPTAIGHSRAGGSMGIPGGMDSWSMAFHAMLEGVLRDAEDMAVTVPYQAIRRHFRRLGHNLNEVTVPRLVIIDAAHDSNIMAVRTGTRSEARRSHKTMLWGLLEDSGGSDGSKTQSWSSGREAAPDIRITGLRDWSNCIFGDPLMATVFNEKPSRDFLRGFDGQPRRRTAGNDPIDADDVDRIVVEDDPDELHEDAHIRLLLYQCYHATMAIVKEFYRPHGDNTARELAARKRLNAVLARLNEVGTESKRNHARPSGETSPSKKTKIENRGSQVASCSLV